MRRVQCFLCNEWAPENAMYLEHFNNFDELICASCKEKLLTRDEDLIALTIRVKDRVDRLKEVLGKDEETKGKEESSVESEECE